ncbi:MAG: parvulin-like peptidyl-prolyl isomerase [Granulosicoccus sp.]|jgi:parvulin-like peptidyl-prolyl isomerase
MKNKKLIITSISILIVILITLASYKLFSNSDSNVSAQNDPRKITIANFSGGKVTLRESQLELDKLILKNEKLRGLTFDNLNADQKESIIKEIILKKTAYKEAKKRNLDESKNYQEALNLFETELLKQQLYADISAKASELDNVQKNYDQLVKELESKKDLRISYIAVKTQNEADDIFEILAKYPNEFARQAERKSIDKDIAKKGGDLGFVLEDVLPEQILNTAKTLTKGQISQPISLGEKWVIVKLTDQRPAQVAKFEDVKVSLARSLAAKALQDFISKSIEDAKITIIVQ